MADNLYPEAGGGNSKRAAEMVRREIAEAPRL
jgi:hypothetical protein